MGSRRSARGIRCAWVSVAFLLVIPVSAGAQTSAGRNAGALTFSGGLDVLPGVAYVRRGIVQESDPTLTLWPYGDIRLALMSGDGGLKAVAINFGGWNSLQTGSSGTHGPSGRLHYEEDFYTTLNLGFGGGLSLGATFTAITSPNDMFTTVKEISVKLSKTHRLAPYGVLAFEIGGAGSGQTDGGAKKGTYLELGIGPRWALGSGKATLSVPVKVGLSLNDYYESFLTGKDEKFGFFDIGGLITIPLAGVPGRFGSWNIHGGVDVLTFGDTTKFFNKDQKRSKVVGIGGIGVTY